MHERPTFRPHRSANKRESWSSVYSSISIGCTANKATEHIRSYYLSGYISRVPSSFLASALLLSQRLGCSYVFSERLSECVAKYFP